MSDLDTVYAAVLEAERIRREKAEAVDFETLGAWLRLRRECRQ